MTLLVPTTSGGWKAETVVAQSAAAAAALVGDLTMFVDQIRIWLVVAAGVDSAGARAACEIAGASEAVHAPCRFRIPSTLRMEPGTCSSTKVIRHP
jgi:hypothetical protein